MPFLLDGSEPQTQEVAKEQRDKFIFSNIAIKCGFTVEEKFVQREGLETSSSLPIAQEVATFAAPE